MRWIVPVLAISLAACGREGGQDTPLDTEQADARAGSSAPLVFSLIDDNTGAVIDADLSDGSDVTADLSHTFTVSGAIKSGKHVNGQVKLRLTDPDGNQTAMTDASAPYTIDSDFTEGAYRLRAVINGNAYALSFIIADTTTTPPGDPNPPGNPNPPPPGGIAHFPAGLTLYWQLTGTINMSRNVDVYDIDLEDNESNGVIQTLHNDGRKVICYFSAGTVENYRSDASQFPASVIGQALPDWPDEKYIDIRATAARNVIASRMDRAVAAGCDAMEPDVLDGFQTNSGFPLTKQDEWNYLTWLVTTAHAKGLAIGLKNCVDLIEDGNLAQSFDWALDEECYDYDECDSLSAFVQAGKAVFIAEYKATATKYCSQAQTSGFDLVIYNLDLNGKTYTPCP